MFATSAPSINRHGDLELVCNINGGESLSFSLLLYIFVETETFDSWSWRSTGFKFLSVLAFGMDDDSMEPILSSSVWCNQINRILIKICYIILYNEIL